MEAVTASKPKASVTVHYITAVCSLEDGGAEREVTKRTKQRTQDYRKQFADY
jgi:hypothetical protein